jgi:hypothetical protein
MLPNKEIVNANLCPEDQSHVTIELSKEVRSNAITSIQLKHMSEMGILRQSCNNTGRRLLRSDRFHRQFHEFLRRLRAYRDLVIFGPLTGIGQAHG